MRESILRSSSSSENRRNSDVVANESGRAKAAAVNGNGNSNGHVVTFAAAPSNANGTSTVYTPSPTNSSPKSGRRNPLRMLSNAIDFRGKRNRGGGGIRHRTSSAEDAEIRIASAAAAIVSQGRTAESSLPRDLEFHFVIEASS